jgi:hypothetical protein
VIKVSRIWRCCNYVLVHGDTKKIEKVKKDSDLSRMSQNRPSGLRKARPQCSSYTSRSFVRCHLSFTSQAFPSHICSTNQRSQRLSDADVVSKMQVSLFVHVFWRFGAAVTRPSARPRLPRFACASIALVVQDAESLR